MLQRFIELGEGYSDIYELIELARSNQHRVSSLLAFHSSIKEKSQTSLCVILKPAGTGDFQPLYICREGIPNPHTMPTKRFEIFENLGRELGKAIVELDVKPSVHFAEKELFYQYLIGILRLNHFIAPLQ
ncbi:methylthioribose kinase [Heyndrickxia acidicola]|uniref:Methylthioribose kinase n=1 Tax=Heyndrickxia acidicola TaxID=209389 RepID=A0ABU6MCF0_9BACI|nr:methylthioribose kinase [Heyndrickxia acidicola]MED1202190.1 methylthioribose kinase [Heyndrickxia acidicola]